jgi:thioredoxin-dependent peroxiredoxin
MMRIPIGAKAPDFALPTTGGETWRLKDAAGEKPVLGSSASHATASPRMTGSRRRRRFPLPLLSDEDEKLCKRFDVIKEKSLYGRKYLGIERSTFLLDGTGVLRREWRKVKVPGHAEEVLEAAQSL